MVHLILSGNIWETLTSNRGTNSTLVFLSSAQLMALSIQAVKGGNELLSHRTWWRFVMSLNTVTHADNMHKAGCHSLQTSTCTHTPRPPQHVKFLETRVLALSLLYWWSPGLLHWGPSAGRSNTRLGTIVCLSERAPGHHACNPPTVLSKRFWLPLNHSLWAWLCCTGLLNTPYNYDISIKRALNEPRNLLCSF